jgi:putative lipoprotein
MRKRNGSKAAFVTVLGVWMLSSIAQAQDTPPAAPSAPSAPKSHRMPAMRKFSYTCDGGVKVIVFLRERNARVTFQDKSYAMKQVDAASGTKYSSGSIVWWSKGDEGFLEDDTNTDQPVKLAEKCKLERAKSAEAAGSAAVSGTVAYRERMAMPESAVLTMQLQDASLTNGADVADAPAKVIAEQKFTFAGHQVPLPFELHYDSAKIDPTHTYALSARITVNGQLMFLNSTTYRVITQGSPTKLDMLLQMVEGQTSKH